MKVSSADAFWLRAETATTPSRWATAIELDPDGEPIDIDDLRAHVSQRLLAMPWASWRIRLPRHRVGRHRWLDTSPLPLERMVLGEMVAEDDIHPHLARIVMQSLDPSLPLWRVRLVTLRNGRQLVVLDAHHAFAGGYVCVELLDRFFGLEERPPVASVSPPRRVSLPLQALDAGWFVAASAYRALSRLRPSARWGPARVGAPLVGPIGPARIVATERLALERVESIGSAYGASTTRVIIALLARALDTYGTTAADRVPSLRALFPHGTQEGDVTRPGNAARSTYLDLPLGLAPAERLVAVRDAIARGSELSHGFEVADITLSFLPMVPELGVGDRHFVSIALSGPLRVCSHPITRLTAIVQRYRDGVFVTFTGDRDSLGDEVPAICARLRAAVDEFERDVAVTR